MPHIEVNGVRLFYEQTGESGDPLVLAHGSWGDHHNWDLVVPELAKSFRVFTYDRRGHSLSERPAGQGSFREDARDLAALIEKLAIAPAHVVGNSGGAAIALRAAADRPELFRSLSVHEPPLFALLSRVPEAAAGLEEFRRRAGAVVELLARGDDEAGARLFVETIAFGPDAWEQLPEATRKTFVFNAPTFLDESRDPDSLDLDVAALRNFSAPVLLTHGTTSAPFFPLVVTQVARAFTNAAPQVLEGAGHVPHLSHPAEFVERVRSFIGRQRALSDGLASASAVPVQSAGSSIERRSRSATR